MIADGQYVVLPPADSFVSRALAGLDAEQALATMVPPDLDAALVPIDPGHRRQLEDQVAELRELGRRSSNLIVVPDTDWFVEADDEGCYLSHTLTCELFLRQGTSTVGKVIVGRIGNGWDFIEVQEFVQPEAVAAPLRNCNANQDTLFSGQSSSGGVDKDGFVDSNFSVSICRSPDGSVDYYGRNVDSGADIRLSACQVQPQVWQATNVDTTYQVIDHGRADGSTPGVISVFAGGDSTDWRLSDNVQRDTAAQDLPATPC